MVKTHQQVQKSRLEEVSSEQRGIQIEMDSFDTNGAQSARQFDQQQQESIDTGRPKRIINPPVRYGFEDMVSYAFSTSSGDPSTFQDAITSSEKNIWMEAMVEEMESLHNNKTWELEELPE